MEESLSAGQKLAEDMLSYVNGASRSDFHDVLDRLDHGHRTLQQALMSLIVEIIRDYARKGPYEYDGRNEATVKLCKAIVERCGNELYLPFV